jgi:phosphatidylinositol alpha-mannosyltransferase
MNISVTSYYMPPVDRIGAGVQMHMLANAYAQLGHNVTVYSPHQLREHNSTYSCIQLNVGTGNRLVRWSIELSRHRYPNGLVHFAGDNHFVRKVKSRAHIRTFLGSCFAEMFVADNLRDRIRMGYLGVTELCGQISADVSTVISADTNRYFPVKCPVVPCGVDLSSFYPSSTKSANPSILFVGILDSRKQGRRLLDAFIHDVRKRIPNAELWIVRDSTQINSPGVKVYGSVSQEQLINLYQQAWCFCLPSKYEGFGVPYIEAMACGTPVVATANPGALEVTRNGKFGIITEVDLLGQTLISVINDHTLRLDLREQGLDYVQRFDILKVAKRYLDLAQGTGKL